MTDLRARLQTALREALRSRDQAAVRAVRSALSAIANAEAVDTAAAPTGTPSTGTRATAETVAGTVPGLGAAEVARRELADDDLESIVAGEISERRAAAEQYRESGRTEPADLLRQEAYLLELILLGG